VVETTKRKEAFIGQETNNAIRLHMSVPGEELRASIRSLSGQSGSMGSGTAGSVEEDDVVAIATLN
jgi:hypothetical protein